MNERPNDVSAQGDTDDQNWVNHPQTLSAEDIENRASLAMIAAIAAMFAALASFAVLAAFPAFAVATAPRLGRGRGVMCAGLRRGRRTLGAGSHELLELASIEPHAATAGAHVKLDARSIYGLHGAVVVRAEEQWHERFLSGSVRQHDDQPHDLGSPA